MGRFAQKREREREIWVYNVLFINKQKQQLQHTNDGSMSSLFTFETLKAIFMPNDWDSFKRSKQTPKTRNLTQSAFFLELKLHCYNRLPFEAHDLKTVTKHSSLVES